MRQDIHEYYRALGLSPGAGPLEIRRAYRQMVQRWHPDLFKAGSPMQATAEDITKEINRAFEQLYRKKLYRKFLSKGRPDPGSGDAPEEYPGEGTSQSPAAETARPPQAPEPARRAKKRPRSAFSGRTPRGERPARDWQILRRFRSLPWAKASATAGLAVLVVLVLQEVHEAPASAPALRSEPPPRATPLVAAGSSTPVTHASMPAEAPRKNPMRPPGAPAGGFGSPRPDGGGPSLPVQTIPFGRAGLVDQIKKDEGLLDVFEVGDSRTRVLAVQGVPDEAGANVLRYGSSLVYFKDGHVSGWSDQEPRLRVREWLTIGSVSADSFTLGSSMREVISAQGRPTEFTGGSYAYGASAVYFENDRVSGWTEADVPLRSFTMPASPFMDLDRTELPFSVR